VAPGPLLLALGILSGIMLLRLARIRYGLLYFLLGAAAWVALQASGVEPVVLGLALGLLTSAYASARADLERATDLFRLFREQPTPELVESARVGPAQSLSPNERLQRAFHPWTSPVIVPHFALANASVEVSKEFLGRAATSPITLGIVAGYVLGKPIGILGTAWLVSRLSRGRLRISIGWGALAGTGAIAGIGFTVSLLIASLAFSGPELQEAKLGILSAAMLASLLAWTVFGLTARLSPARRTRALLGTAETLIDLAVPVDPNRDHIRGSADAKVTLVEYGDFECPYCGQAETVLANFGDLRYVWRQLPLTDVHPNAALSAEATEAADRQGAFWPMHDLLLQHQQELRPVHLVRYAADLGLDVDRFREDVRRHVGAGRVADDVDSAGSSGVAGIPTFFVNGRRQYGAYDIDTLTAAVKTAKTQAKARPAGPSLGSTTSRLTRRSRATAAHQRRSACAEVTARGTAPRGWPLDSLGSLERHRRQRIFPLLAAFIPLRRGAAPRSLSKILAGRGIGSARTRRLGPGRPSRSRSRSEASPGRLRSTAQSSVGGVRF
jgi:protein-disulfide isomerase